MKRNKKIVLFIGAAIIILTFFAILISFIIDINNDNQNIHRFDKETLALNYCLFVFPVLPEEISLLRSVYKLLFYQPGRIAKICYIASICLIVVYSVFQILVFTNVIKANDLFSDDSPGLGAASSRFAILLLLTEWAAIIVSFILGSVR